MLKDAASASQSPHSTQRVVRASGGGPQAPTPTLDDVDWLGASRAQRSYAGKTTGVYFLEPPRQRREESAVVAKPYTYAQSELLATRLAREVGLEVPDMEIARSSADLLRQKLKQKPGMPILLMRRVIGRDFSTIPARDLKKLGDGTPESTVRLETMGRVCSFDYFIGNFDRLPVVGLNGNNPGNLMLTHAGITCIDNTLCLPELANGEVWRDSFRRALRRALQALNHEVVPVRVEGVLASITEFFPQGAELTWEKIREPFLAGFRAGTRRIAELTKEKLDAEIQTTHRHLLPMEPGVKDFLHANLRDFRKADALWPASSDAGASTSGLPPSQALAHRRKTPSSTATD